MSKHRTVYEFEDGSIATVFAFQANTNRPWVFEQSIEVQNVPGVKMAPSQADVFAKMYIGHCRKAVASFRAATREHLLSMSAANNGPPDDDIPRESNGRPTTEWLMKRARELEGDE